MAGSAAETPTQPDVQLPGQMRASDAERDAVVARLTEGFAAGRLSHDTFMYRMSAVLKTRHRADLPALHADLPATPQEPGRAAALLGRLRAAWPRAPRRPPPSRPVPPLARPAPPVPLTFPRGAGDSFSIGRAAECDLTIADMTVSRVHATLERTADGWLLTDLSSTNGTRVNGWRARGRVPVKAGDVVSFGNARYSLRAADVG
jgi:hypothetical protein